MALVDGRWLLLLFLSSTCVGCADVWSGAGELVASGSVPVDVVLVTRGPTTESADAVQGLAHDDATVVMSDEAFRAYRVTGPPFYVLIGGAPARVVDEGVVLGAAQVRDVVTSAQRATTSDGDAL